ncbi:hypothetical protein CG007_00475 [Mesoplasma entomophilum]|uniref:hypothetical protein n=1 Tax=Mesoplasma entomophilum TaxID=2149 RepID=UPI000D03398F|nr:hypothetical protein [Mesoplasma entomophilum]AVN60109.1 hypothetical protein CG007_00475 [Mesoplasma entomophilum]
MKKLLSIITALTVAASATSSLVSCKVITNEFKIEFDKKKSVNNKIKYTWNETTKSYIPKQYNENETGQQDIDFKNALEGYYGIGRFASSLISDSINALFYNADLSSTKNNLNVWQYTFRTEDKERYSDGQYRTAGLSKEEDIKKYYDNPGNISSMKGLVEYNKNKLKNKQTENVDQKDGPIILDDTTMSFINNMFDSSNNQGITNVKIISDLDLYEGKINKYSKSSQETKSSLLKWESGDNKNFISEETNYNAKMAKEKKYNDFVVGGDMNALSFDPFSQVLISGFSSNSTFENENHTPLDDLTKSIKINEVNEQTETKGRKAGEILNKKDDASVKEGNKSNIVFEYSKKENKDKDGKGNGTFTYTPFTYGYALLPLNDLEMEISYNTDIELKTGKPRGDDYKINVTISGLNAAFQPKLGFTTQYKEDGSLDAVNSGNPYLGWQFAGYQFNSKNILQYDENGDLFTERISKKVPPYNKKFNDFNIAKLSFEKVQNESKDKNK